MTKEQKIQVIRHMYEHEGGVGLTSLITEKLGIGM